MDSSYTLKEIPTKFEHLSRIQQAIMLVLYKNHPIQMSEDEILEIIIVDGLLEMSDEQFDKYHKDLIEWKEKAGA